MPDKPILSKHWEKAISSVEEVYKDDNSQCSKLISFTKAQAQHFANADPSPSQEKQFQYCQVIHTPVEKLEQENERLKAELAEARRLLADWQWSADGDSIRMTGDCPSCGHSQGTGHSGNCEYQAFLDHTDKGKETV